VVPGPRPKVTQEEQAGQKKRKVNRVKKEKKGKRNMTGVMRRMKQRP
jgi:hypothetical protein